MFSPFHIGISCICTNAGHSQLSADKDEGGGVRVRCARHSPEPPPPSIIPQCEDVEVSSDSAAKRGAVQNSQATK